MKTIKILALTTLTLCAATALAGPKGKKSSKKEKAEKVDTLTTEQFSYAFGKINTTGLKSFLTQRMGVDTTFMADFLEGFGQPELTEADKKMKARLAGIEIRQQVENQILPQAARSINDSVDVIDHNLFLQGFGDGIADKQNSILPVSTDSMRVLVEKQMEYYEQAKYRDNIEAGEQFLAKNKKQKGVVTTPSGLQYKVITAGTGEKPAATDRVTVNYRGTLLDGTEFDSSYKRNEPTTFGVNQVIKGWTEALQLMPVGSKWEIYIPQELGYGSRSAGNIPPYSTLIFEVELLEIAK